MDKLKVVRRTRDQVELSIGARRARRANVAGAFTSRGPVAGRILLVDDVFTTGVTLSECCGVLRKAGVGEIHTLTLWDSLAVSDRQSTIGRVVDSERRFAKIGGLRERMVWRRLPAANRRRKADSGPQATAAAKEAKWT